MSHGITLTLLTTIGLALGAATAAGAQPVPPPVAGGFYDSFGRQPDSVTKKLPPNDRVLKIEPLKLGGLRFSIFDRNGQFKGSTLLVRKCTVQYDGRLASYYQNFETVPARSGVAVEQVTFVFRINDPTGDYDVYFRQPGGPLTSEVIKRR